MPDPVLTLLKYVFLAILYLFFLRVLRAVWVELREPRAASFAPAPAAVAAAGDQTVAVARPAAPAPAGGAEHLVVIEPPAKRGSQYPLAPEMTVGRAGGCAVLLDDDSYVSQLHARIFRRDGQVFVEDLGSTNGTFVNSQRISAPVAINQGDVVVFGRTAVELRR